jgi:hypothetical protein
MSNQIDSKLQGDDTNQESDIPIKRKLHDPGPIGLTNQDETREENRAESEKKPEDDFDSGFID